MLDHISRYLSLGLVLNGHFQRFLRKFWEAQTIAYEKGSGWIMWTWKAEDADEWSYQAGAYLVLSDKGVYQEAHGVLPQVSSTAGFRTTRRTVSIPQSVGKPIFRVPLDRTCFLYPHDYVALSTYPHKALFYLVPYYIIITEVTRRPITMWIRASKLSRTYNCDELIIHSV